MTIQPKMNNAVAESTTSHGVSVVHTSTSSKRQAGGSSSYPTTNV